MTEKYRLSKHFTLYEFDRTPMHKELADENERLAVEEIITLRELAEHLEIIREHFNTPLVITSGIRCQALNKAVGGCETSQHLTGEAADFYAPTGNLKKIFVWIMTESALRYGQVIYETRQATSWIHYSLGEPYRERKACRQALIYDGKTYRVISPGMF